uniref:4Fe-4S binding protein n=1 Tax=Desulfobacca acetoxidans TaxID=60893 RepID=A0A7V4G8T2_9BACT
MSLFRRLVQILVSLGTNAYLLFPLTGTIYTGPLKAVCHPGLNCYACPAALLSCPVGAIQNFIGALRATLPGSFPNLGAIVFAYLGFAGTLVGRLPCGWLCPFGFIQDLLYKIPSPKFSLWPPLRWLKYAVLLVLVVLLPLLWVDRTGMGEPWFCKLLCPSGTLLGALPLLAIKPELWQNLGLWFWNKMTWLVLIMGAAVLISRFFCRVMCPLGAFYSLFSRITVVQLEFIEGNCVHCLSCVRSCPTGCRPHEEQGSRECIMCLKCVDACRFRALNFGLRRPLPPPRAQTVRRP